MKGKTLLSFRYRLVHSLPALLLFWFLWAVPLRAQTPPAAGAVSGNVQPPIPGTGHDYIHLLSETVNPATGNLTVRIQLPAPKGRGITTAPVIAYNSGELSALIEPGGQLLWATSTQNPMGQATGWGAPTSVPLSIGASEWNFTSPEPPQGWSEIENCNTATGYSFTDLNGTSHTLGVGGETLATNNGNGGQCNTSMVNTGTSDGQTAGAFVSNAQQELANGYAPGVNIGDIYGNTYSGSPGADGAGTVTMEDRNGNQITPGSWTLQNGIWQPNGTDTAARTMALQIPAVAGTYNLYGLHYTIATETISLNYTPQQALTTEEGASNCNVTGVFGANNASITVISSITLPNGQQYQFHYDSTYGTLNEIDYPDGGKITYTWGVTSGYYNQVAAFPATQSGTGMPMTNACTVQYQTPVVVGRTIYFNGSTDVQYQGFYYTTTWNQTSWTQRSTSITTTDAILGKSFNTYYQYSPTANDVAAPFNTAVYPTVPMEQQVQHTDWGSSIVLDTVTEAWYNQYQKACEVHTLDSGQSYGHFYTWQYGLISDDKEYDFNSVSGLANYCTPTSYAPPSTVPTRETVTTFQQFTSPVPPNLTFAKPQNVAVYANGNEIAETDYGYDQFAVEPIASLTSHDETHFPSTVSSGRGNATTLTRKCFGCSQGDSVTTYHYDETGQMIAITDACGNGSCSEVSAGSPPACFSYSSFSPTSHTTCYSYADSPSNGGQTDAYLTGIAYPSTKTAHTESFTWNYEQGELTSSTDQNNQKTTYQYNDSLARLTETQGPPDPNNGNQQSTTTISYNDSAPNPSVTTSELLNTSGAWKTTVAVMDGMGHKIQTQATSDTQGTDYVDMSYDGEGRVYTQSNPHRSGSSSSDGTTTFYYDVLGRNVATVHPDNTYATNCYNGVASSVQSGITVKCNSQIGLSSGSWVDSTDERGDTWQRSSDAFGDLLEAVEPNGTSQTPSMQTLYAYDGLGDLLSVVQHGDGSGDRDRYFAYDSLGRLLATMNPENSGSLNSPQPGYTAPAAVSCGSASNGLYSGPWTTCYTYDLNGNLSSKEDNRQITISYTYDNLNRLTWKHYSDGVTLANGFGYDGYDENGNAVSGVTYADGRLTGTSNEVNAASHYSYDVMGRPVERTNCLPVGCFSSPAVVNGNYDLAGDLISMSNGATQQLITLGYTYDGAGRLQTLTSNWAPDCNHPSTLFSGPAYGPVGLTTATLATPNSGCSTNEITEARSYNNRTRIASESYNASAMAATAPTGSISIPASDSEQSRVVGQAAGTGWISIGGGEQSVQIQVQCGPYGQTCPQTIYDSGTVTATINGTQYTIGYGQTDTPYTVANNLASNINNSSSVSATASNGTVNITALTTGSQTNYSLSVTSATNMPQYFSSPSFTTSASGGSLTGGSNGTTVYDTGTMTATVNGVQAQANWGQGDTPSSVATRLASSIQSQMGSFLTATASGSSITLKSNSTDYWTVSVAWNDTNTQYFSSPSFTAAPSGMTPNSSSGVAYSYNVSYDGVGNTISLSDSVMGNWTYQYDSLNRLLTTGQASGGPYNGQYGCWTYDGFGNRATEAISGTACNNSPTPVNWAHYNTSNQITGTGSMTAGNDYDAAGNVINDGFNQYLYDGAGRICAARNISTGALTGYVYDGEGNRVAKGSLSSFSCNLSSNGFSASTQYVIGLGGEQLTELDGSNRWQHTNVFAGGALLATYGGAGQNSDTYFALTDWQGTKRAQTGVGGCLTGWSSLPFGNNGTNSGPVPVSINVTVQCSIDATEHHYTGKVHDSETGNDDFGARYYASTAARWFSPDWEAAAEAVPYASYGSPQTLNLYAFVGNNPLSHVDPDGHQDNRVGCGGGSNGGTDFSCNSGTGSSGVGADSNAPEDGGWNPYEAPPNQGSQAQQQNSEQAPDNTLLAQNNTPPPPGRTPAQGGEPNSTVEIPDGKGGKTVRKFGPDGRAETDIDHGHDHGAGDPHAHDWDWGKKPPRQPGRPLTPEEQKNVKRAAGGVTAGVIIYWIISEGSRLFPPRNLIPVP